MRGPEITIAQILAWADAFYQRMGRWPTMYSGRIGRTGENWRKVDSALRLGLRGLPGGTSLPRLLTKERGARNSSCLPRLSLKQVLAWADAHHQRTGIWPRETSGSVDGSGGETWFAVDRALRAGVRGLPGGTSLARLLAGRRGVRNIQALPPLTVDQILTWADAHHRRTRTWPRSDSGPVTRVPGETWSGINAALQKGRRGFKGGSSLARLLAEKRGVRNPKQPPRLTIKQILQWADAHRERTGTWPDRNAGAVDSVPGETWAMIDRALRHGYRGLRGRSSLYRLLCRERKIGRAREGR